MSELRQALAEINAIRVQVARDTQFRGFGPLSIAASGMLALLVAAVQSRFMKDGHDIATACVSVALTAVEMIGRTRRVHCGLAKEMIHAAVERFLPAIVVGVLLTAVLSRAAPQELWMLPGLWQLLFCTGVFASCRLLPRPTMAVGIWYLVAGLPCLVVQSADKSLSPWDMGIPFGVGQLLVAVVLLFGFETTIEET